MQKIKHPTTGKMITPPLFATQWKFSTVEESNDKGSWSNYAIEKIGLIQDRDTMLEAKAFRDSVAAGEAKAVPEDSAESKPSSKTSSIVDDDIPF